MRRRYGPHAGRSRQLLVTRDADGGERGDPGGGASAGTLDRQGLYPRNSTSPASRLVFANRRVFDASRTRITALGFDEAVQASANPSSAVWERPVATRLRVQPGSLSRGRRRSVAGLLLLARAWSKWTWINGDRLSIGSSKLWIAHDVGRCINPALVMGQIEGSIYMGLGEAMMEESAFRRLPPKRSHALVHKFPSLLEYKSPTFPDMPKMTSYIVEDPDPNGPFGAKEVGQGPLLPIMPAFCNAIFDAVGVRVDQVPVHPDMIVRAREEKARGGPGRYGPKRFPDCRFGDPLRVPTPAEGGDGKAVNADAIGVRHGTMKESPEGVKS